MNVLVIAPHPDDEALGCGGTILKHADSGDNVDLCIVTKAYTPDWSEKVIKEKHEEVLKARKMLGIKNIYFCDFPTLKLNNVSWKELCDKLTDFVKKSNAEIVYIPFAGDMNMDHRMVSQAALVATRPATGSVKKILAYETLSETEWGATFPFAPNFFVDIEKYLDKKIEAIKVYKTEIREYPHPRSPEGVKYRALSRGTTIGKRAAEAFMLIREIR